MSQRGSVTEFARDPNFLKLIFSANENIMTHKVRLKNISLGKRLPRERQNEKVTTWAPCLAIPPSRLVPPVPPTEQTSSFEKDDQWSLGKGGLRAGWVQAGYPRGGGKKSFWKADREEKRMAGDRPRKIPSCRSGEKRRIAVVKGWTYTHKKKKNDNLIEKLNRKTFECGRTSIKSQRVILSEVNLNFYSVRFERLLFFTFLCFNRKFG